MDYSVVTVGEQKKEKVVKFSYFFALFVIPVVKITVLNIEQFMNFVKTLTLRTVTGSELCFICMSAMQQWLIKVTTECVLTVFTSV